MPRVHRLLTTFLKYNKLKLYKGNSPSDFLGGYVSLLQGEFVASGNASFAARFVLRLQNCI